MSVETWMKEFYPVPADMVKPEDALDHSLKKWEGALPENAERHGVTLDEDGVRGPKGGLFLFNDMTCSLCANFLNIYFLPGASGCARCPIVQVTGHDCISKFMQLPDAVPMVNLLRKVKEATSAAK